MSTIEKVCLVIFLTCLMGLNHALQLGDVSMAEFWAMPAAITGSLFIAAGE